MLWLHLTAGLTLAIYAILLGVSGSVLVFRDELTALAYPDFHRPSGAATVSPDQAFAVVRREFPDWRTYSLTWPTSESPNWMAYMIRGSESREAYVDGRSGALLGTRDPSGGVIGWLMGLHVDFHAGSTGRLLNGIGALALVGMSVTGVILWWPPAGQFRSRFHVDWHVGWRRLSWQLHHFTGIVALLFVAVLGFTGGYYVWGSTYIAAVDRVFERAVTPSMPAHAADEPLASLTELGRRAMQAIPGRPAYRMSIPSPDQPVQITLLEGVPGEFHKVSTVVLDPVSAAVLQTGRYEARPAGNSILAWFSVLHFGRFGGFAGKVLWAVLALSLPVLSVTGCLMWWRRVVEPRLRKDRAPAGSTVSA